MRLTALTVGSRGDAKPYLALAGAAAGWPPGDLATPARSSPTPAAWGLGFAPTEGNPRQMLETEQGDAWLEAGRHPLRGTRRLLAVARPLAARLLADATAACQDAEAIIYARGGLAAPRSPSATASRRCWPRCCRSASPGRSRPRARPPGGLGGAYNPAQPPGRRAVRLAAVPRADQPVAAPHPGAAARAAARTRPHPAAPTSTGPVRLQPLGGAQTSRLGPAPARHRLAVPGP